LREASQISEIGFGWEAGFLLKPARLLNERAGIGVKPARLLNERAGIRVKPARLLYERRPVSVRIPSNCNIGAKRIQRRSLSHDFQSPIFVFRSCAFMATIIVLRLIRIAPTAGLKIIPYV
jgi:hypothetical protein